MKVVSGDLVQMAVAGEFDVIVHGCNCQCVMGKGIALTIRKRFPEALAADRQTKKSDPGKLGSCSVAIVESEAGPLHIANAYTQFHWRGKADLANYDAIRSCPGWVREMYPSARIGLPKIGAGLAGGDWERIWRIMQEELDGTNATLVRHRPRR